MVPIAYSLTTRSQFGIECLSPTFKSTGVGHFVAKFGEKRLTDVKPNFNAISERHGLSYAKDIFCRLSTMHEHDKHTNRQTSRQTVTSISISEIAFSDVA